MNLANTKAGLTTLARSDGETAIRELVERCECPSTRLPMASGFRTAQQLWATISFVQDRLLPSPLARLPVDVVKRSAHADRVRDVEI